MNRETTYSIISIFLLIGSIVYTLVVDNLLSLANVHFYFYLFLIVFGVFYRKAIRLDTIWIVGFVFIVLSEMLLLPNEPSLIRSSKYIIIGCNLLLIGYNVNFNPKQLLVEKREYVIRSRGFFFFILIVLYALYLIQGIPYAIISLRYGRYAAKMMTSSTLFSSFIGNLSYLLPAFFAFYYKEKKHGLLLSLLWSIPVFVVLICIGSRFPFLFSVCGFVISRGVLSMYTFKMRDIKVVIIIILIVFGVSNFMKQMRTHGLQEMESENKEYNVGYLSQKAATKMSPEGVIYMNAILHDHCKAHGYLYGKNSSFIFYFWIPRSLWKNKPEMLGKWLPNKYQNVSEGHSASVGIWGELYVDFGYLSLLVIFVLGILLKKLDSICQYISLYKGGSISIIFVSLVFPYVFFSARSPITSFIVTIISLSIFVLIRKVAFKKIIES